MRTHRGGRARWQRCCCGQHAFPTQGLTSEGPSSLSTPLPALQPAWGGVFPQESLSMIPREGAGLVGPLS